jgi:hypothetical protein
MTPEIPPQTPTETTPETSAEQLTLYQHPAGLSAYMKHRKNNETPADFADFIRDLKMTDFDDMGELREVFESQAHMLGAIFQYLMMEGNWKSLPMALRAQKMMLDTIDTIHVYPTRKYMESRMAFQPPPMPSDADTKI